MAQPITFWFDFASPYAYLAATQIDRVAARHGRSVAWRPILLGAVFKGTGYNPTGNVQRGAYMRSDVARFARMLGVPHAWPDSFPLNSVPLARAVYWLEESDPALARAFALEAFTSHWGRGENPTDPATMASLAAGLGIDGAALAAGTQDAAVKDRLRQETDGAIAAGVFGAPTFLVDGELLWGADRLGQVEWLLERQAAA